MLFTARRTSSGSMHHNAIFFVVEPVFLNVLRQKSCTFFKVGQDFAHSHVKPVHNFLNGHAGPVAAGGVGGLALKPPRLPPQFLDTLSKSALRSFFIFWFGIVKVGTPT